MPTTTVTDLDAYRREFEQAYPITRRLMELFPESHLDHKVTPSAMTPRGIGWAIALTQIIVPHLLKDELAPGSIPQAPAEWSAVIAAADAGHAQGKAAIGELTDAAWEADLILPVGPKKMGPMRRGDALRMFLHDHIHHRGQFSVHLRAAGAKVPSIYGPSGDEPWF